LAGNRPRAISRETLPGYAVFDESAGETRFEAALLALQRSRPRLGTVSERRAVRRYTVTLRVLGCLLVALAVALIVVLAWGLHTGG